MRGEGTPPPIPRPDCTRSRFLLGRKAARGYQLRLHRTMGPASRIPLVAAAAGLALAWATPAQDPLPQPPKAQEPAPRPPKPQEPLEPLPGDRKAEQRGQPVRELSVDDALRMGRASNVELRAAELVPQQAQRQLIEAEALFLPELFGDVGYSDARTPGSSAFAPALQRSVIDATMGWRQRVTTGGLFELAYQPARIDTSSASGAFPPTQFSSDFLVSYTQPLLRGGWTEFNLAPVSSARYAHARSRHEFERSVQDTLQAIVAAYWELAFMRENYRVVDAALAVAREQLRITDERIRVRELAPRDRVADEAEVATRSEELILAANEIERRQDILRRLLFDDQEAGLWRTNLRPTDPIAITPEVAPIPFEPFAQAALQHRPDLKALRSDVAAAEVDLVVADSNLLPVLDLVGSYTTDSFSDEFQSAWRDSIEAQFPEWGVRLQFRLPIGNQGARAARDQAALEVERRKRVLYGAMMTVEQEVRDAVRSLERLAQSIHASGETVRLAESNLETEQVKLRVGSSTAFEVQRRNQALREARSRHLRNQLEYRIAESRLLYVQGRLSVPQ